MKKYKVAVVIGRFQPAHHAHMKLFEKGLEIAEKLVIVLGSARSPRTIKNPWTYDERKTMLEYSFPEHVRHRVYFKGVMDTIYSDAEWVANVSEAPQVAMDDGFINNDEIAIIAHSKDESSYYLNYFKQWDAVDIEEVLATDKGPPISSTKIRELFFDGYMNFVKSACPEGVYDFLCDFRKTDEFDMLLHEYKQAIEYDKKFENAPYGYTNFVTVDAMVVQSGHVLLVRRKESPGAGLWALPGGHLEVSETFLQGAIRELREETGIKVPEKVLRGSVVYDKVYDHPERSLRGRVKKKIGRTITRMFLFKLDDNEKLPRVKNGSDASECWWFTFAEIRNMRDQLFEDHFDIINDGLNKI